MQLSTLSPERQRNFPLRYERLNQVLNTVVSFISGNPDPDPHHKMSEFRPPLDFWGPKGNRPVEGEKPKPKPDPKPVVSPSPSPGGIGGKIAKAVGAFVDAMLDMFPPPPNSGIRPVYISSMSIGGRRPEPE